MIKKSFDNRCFFDKLYYITIKHMTLDKLKWKLKPLVNQQYSILSKYNIWEDYWYETMGNNSIKVTLKNTFFDSRTNKNKMITEEVTDRTFNKLLRLLNAEKLYAPVNNELWYEQSLEWLYFHYPYGETDANNCMLINSENRILAIQYNWCKHTSVIQSNNVFIIPSYIVLNNKKKLEGEYKSSDYEAMEPMLEKLFNI